MTGGELLELAAPTVMENAGSDAVAEPSLTEITTLEYVPTWDALGAPESRPVDVLKLAHAGRFWIEKPRLLPSGSDAVGRKLYVLPTVTDVTGVPEITGARLLVGDADAEILNAGKDARAAPSVTVIRMLDHVPADLGEPYRAPE